MKYHGKSEASCCDTGLLERPRYFPRKLVTDGEMTLEQEYFLKKLRLHNRMLHGWGVVCGAQVCRVPSEASNGDEECPEPEPDGPTDDSGNGANDYQAWKVKVKPGYILGPYGDEILIDCAHEVDLRTNGVQAKTGEPCEQAMDPWCSQVTVERDRCVFVAVKYKESKSRPVRVQPVGCGCDDADCEYSRWCDGYEIGILTDCPDNHLSPPEPPEFPRAQTPRCPDCSPQPWVVLARVCISDDGETLDIDDCFCRRHVAAFGDFWWSCANGGTDAGWRIEELKLAEEAELMPGTDHSVNVRGAWPSVKRGTSVRLGDGIEIGDSSLTKSAIKFKMKVLEDAKAGPRTLLIIAPDGKVLASKNNAIVVEKKGSG